MAESSTHQLLVAQLSEWVHQNVACPENTLVLSDLSTTVRGDKPPSIGGYNPDVFCRVIGGGLIVIGEAKTTRDIETRHSREQFRSYLLYLKQCTSGTLVIAVPWHAVNQVKSLIRMLQRETSTMHIRTVFLERLPG